MTAGVEIMKHLPLQLCQVPTRAPTTQIKQEENHNATIIDYSMEAKHIRVLDNTSGDEATTCADFDAWIDLPRDMCRLILDHLGAFDILTFPLVCRPWADVYAEKRRLQPGGLQPGAPTLLTSPSDCGWDIEDDYLRGLFFINNFLSREAFLVEVEGLRYRSWIGGKDEWLVTTVRASFYTIELLNPITGCCIPLPDNLPAWSSFDRVQLCQTPTEASDGYFAIAISDNMLAYTMAGSCRWITLVNPNGRWMNYSDAIMHGGKIIAICLNGDLWSWDLEQGGGKPELVLSSSVNNSEGWRQMDLILAPSGKGSVLILSPHGEDVPDRWLQRGSLCGSNNWNFLVDGVGLHEVNIDTRSIEEVCDIGDRALFLGTNYPFYVHVPVPLGHLKKNHVYISTMSDHDVVAVDLSLRDLSGSVSVINYARTDNPNQVPMWFRPAFP